jgi:hypothetical protein
LSSEFKTAEPLLRGQRAGGGIESAIKIIACHSLSPSFSAMKTQKLAPSPCLSPQKSSSPKWLWFTVAVQVFLDLAWRHWHRWTSGQAWTTKVVNPFPLCPNALHNDLRLCALAATHTSSPKPRASLLLLWSCYDRSAHLKLVPALFLYISTIPHAHITRRSYITPILPMQLPQRHPRTLTPLRTLDICIWSIAFVLAHSSYFWGLPFDRVCRAPHDACLTRCSLRSVLLLLQHWLLCAFDQRFAGSHWQTADKQRYTLERVVGSGDHGERLLLHWKMS